MFEGSPDARALFEQADELLNRPLSRLCFEGPEEELSRTENTQPALYVASLAARAALGAEGIEPTMVAGHSLGEYSALAAAGALSFADGLRCVQRRGEIMAAIAGRSQGGMVAILGLPTQAVSEICAEAGEEGVVEIANYNAPTQTVIAGTGAALQRAIALAKERGAARVTALKVSAPFHSSLMSPATEEMARVLDAAEIRPAVVPVVANVTADYVRTRDEIRAALLGQLAGSVRWTETIRRLAADGLTHCVEVGPGRVLSGLCTRIVPDLVALPAGELIQVRNLRVQLA